MRVRAVLAPGGAEGEYTFGVETDGGPMHTCTISHLFPTQSWRLGIGSSDCSTSADGTTTMNGASEDCVGYTNGLQASPPVPATATQLSPRPRTPRDPWAAVRTRCEAIRAANALREQDLADRLTGIREMREERTRRLSKERWQRSQRSLRGLEGLSSGEGPIVRV